MSISNGSEGSGSDWMLLDNDNAHQQDNEEGAAMPLEEEVTAQEKTRECSDEERTEVNKENVKETNIKSQEKIKSTLSVKEKINQKRQEGKSKSTSLKEEIDEKVKERKRNNAQEKNHEEVELGELEENLEELEYKVEEVKGHRYHKISTGTESSDIEILDCHSNWQEIDGDFHHVQFVNPLTLPTCFSSIQQNEQIITQSYSNMSTYRQKRSSYSGIPAHSRQLVSPSSSGIPAHSRQLVSPSSSGIHSHRFHVPPSLSGINHQPVEGYLRSFRYQDYIYDSDTDTESQCAENSAVDRLRRRRSQKSEATQDEETDLSLVSSPSLPEDLPAIRPDSQYVHTPHDSLNYRLNVILMLTVACVIGLGLGHFLGWSEGWADRTVFDANMNAAQVRRLRELQENLLSCLNSVHQLTQNLENYPIPVDQSGLHGFSPHEHSEERVFRSGALLERDLDQDPSSGRQFLGSRSSPRLDSLDAENYRILKFKSKETQSNHRDVVDFKASQKFLDLRVSDKLISESDAEPGDILELSDGEQLKKVDAKDLNFLRLFNTEKFEHFDKFEVNRIENAVNLMTNFAKNTKEIFEKNEIESEKNVDSKMKEIDSKRKLIVSETKEIESEKNVADSENNEIEFEKDVADFESNEIEFEKDVADFESNEIEFEKNVADFKSNEIEFEKNEIFSDDLEIDSEFVGTESVENSIYEMETESFYSFDESFDTPDFSGELVEKLEDSGIINLDNDYKTNDHDLKVEEDLREVEFENIEEKTNNFDQKSESFVGAEHDQVALDDLIYPAHLNRDFHDEELFVDDDIYQDNGKVNNEKNNQKKEKDYQKHDNYQKNVDDLNCVKNHPYDDDLIFPVIDEENSDYLSEKLLQYKVSDNSFGDEIITVDNSYKHNHLKNDLIVKEPDLVPEGKEISKIDGFKIISEMNGNFENYADNYDNFEKNDENLQNSKVLNTEFDFNTHMKTRFENEPIKIDLFHFNLARENENFFKKTTTNVLKFESEKRSELKTDVIPFIAEYSKIFPKDIDAKSPLLKAIHDDDFTELDEFSESTDPENSLDKLSESTDPEKLLDTFSESTDSENLFDKLSESTDSENLLETFSESTDSGNLLDSPESDPVDPYFYFENPSTADYFNSIQEMNSIRENKTVNNRGGWKPDADSVNNFSDKFCSVNKELMKENERGFLSELSSLSLDFDYMKANLNTNYDTNRKVDIDENLKFKLVDIDQNNDEQCANKDLNIEEMDNVSIFSFEILPNNEIKMKKPFNLPRNLPKDAKIEPVLPHNEITSKNNGSKIDSILPNIVLETNKKVLEDLQLENVVLEKDVAKLQNENQDKFKIKGREGEESRLLRQEITDLIAENEAIKTALLGEKFSQSDNTEGNISGDFYQENLMKHHKLSLEKEKFVHLVSDVEELRASLKSLKATNEELNKQLIIMGIEQDIPKELNPLLEQLVKIREKLSVEETKKDSAENDAILKAKAYLAYMTQVVSVFPRMSKFSELEPEEKVDVATDVFSFVVPKGLKFPPKVRNELAKAKTQFGSIKESLSKKYKRLKSLTTGESLSAAKGASLDKMKRVIVSVVNKMKDIGQKIILKPAVEASKKTTEDETTLQNLETLTESIFKLNTDFDHAWQTLEEQQNITIKIDDEKSEINANEKIENVNNKTKISSKSKKFEVKKDKNNNKIEKEKRNYKLKNENNRKYNKTGKKLSEKVEKYQEKNLNMEKSKSLKLESPKNDENLSPKKDEDGKNSEYYKGQYNKADKIAKTSHENSENMEKSAKKSDAKKETSVLGQIWTKSTERKMKFIRRGGKNKYKSRNESSLENFDSLGGVYESSLEKIESFGDESSFRSKNVESNNNNNGKYFKDKNNRDNLDLLKFKNIENKNLKNKISKNEKFNDDFEKRKLRKLLENNPEKLENNTKKLENNPDKWGKNYGKLKGKVSKSKSNRGKLESKSNNLESNQDNGKDKSIKNLGSKSGKLESKPEELERKTNKLESDQAKLESKRSEFKNKKVKNEINFESKENGKNEVKESKSRKKIDTNKDYKNEVKESKSRKKIDNKENKNEVKEKKLHKKDDNKENKNEVKEKKLHKKDDNKENKNEVKEKKLHKKDDNNENKNEVKENKLHKKVDSKEKKNEVEERRLRKKVDNKKNKNEVKAKKLHKKDENKKNKNEIKENKLHKKVDNKENKNEVKERGLRNKIDNKENKNEAKERELLKKGDNKRSKKEETESKSKNCDHRNKYKSKETDSRCDKNFDSKHKIANIKNFKPRNLQFKNEEGKKKQKYNKFENNKKYDREAQRKRHESVEKFSKINRVKRTTDEEGKYKRKKGKVRVNYKEGKDRSRQEKYAENDMFSKNNEKYREKKDNFEDGKNVILKKIENYDREKGTLESKEKINRNTIAKKTDKNSRKEDNFVSKNKKNYNKRLKHENKKENEKSKSLIDREKYQHKRAKYGDGKRGRNLMHETESKFDEDERIVKEKKENLGKDEKVESNRLKPQEKINKNIKKEKIN